MREIRRWLCLIMCLMLCPVAMGEQAEPAAPNVRVLLRRLNLTDRIDLDLTGGYLASWKGGRMLIPSGSRITLQIREDKLILFYQGAALECGAEVSLTRAAAEGKNQPDRFGLTIAPWDGLYPGDLRLTVSGGQLQPVLTINVEDYLLGVVPYEMSEDFPLEALKAQAVCARTYALGKVDASKEYDLVDTTNDQVFRPVIFSRSRTAQAVSETAGLVGTSGGGLAHCYYSASNGGQTELPQHVWSGGESAVCYAITEDPYDLENPESIQKKVKISKNGRGLPEAFEDLLREAVFQQPEMKEFAAEEDCFRIDEIQEAALTEPRFAAPSRLMTRLEIRMVVSGRKYLPAESAEPSLDFEPDEETVTAAPRSTGTPESGPRLGDYETAGVFTLKIPLFPQAIRALGLSIYGADNEIVTVEETRDGWTLISGRYGHGVGMSQRGAQWMAARYGKSFQEILEFYYPGMVLKKAAAGAAVIPTAAPLLAESPGPAATPTPRPTLMPVTTGDLPEGAWLASVEGIEDDSSLNLRAEPSAAGEILMRLYRHQQLIVLETCEDPVWVRVRTDSAEGYVMVSFLEKVE